MRWDQIQQLIQQPFCVLVEYHTAKPKYFLIQNNTTYSVSAVQFERIKLAVPLVIDETYVRNFESSVEMQMYKSRQI